MKLDGCRALITGASAGIGWEFAQQLAPRAKSILLIARRADRLEELRSELEKKNPALEIDVRAVDLSDEAEVEAFCEWITQEPIEIDLLINNAGLGDYGAFARSEAVRLKEMMNVNMSALTLLMRCVLPQMLARKRGAILNVASSAGFLPISGIAVYAASKSYVISLSEGLRMELHGTGVAVTALCPGPVHTEFGEVAKRSAGSRKAGPEIAHVSVERVVRAALDGVEANRAIVIPGLLMKLGMILVRLMPMPILRLVGQISSK